MSCDRLWLHIPWSALHSRPVQIKLGRLRVQLRVHSEGPYTAAEGLRKALAQGAPRKAEQKTLRLSDVRLAVLDRLRITLESLHLLCADAAAGLLATKPRDRSKFQTSIILYNTVMISVYTI